MTKSIFPALAFSMATLLTSTPVAAQDQCELDIVASPQIQQALQKSRPLDFEGFEAFCSALQEEALQVTIRSDLGVLRNQGYAWVLIQLKRPTTGAMSDAAETNTAIGDATERQQVEQMQVAIIRDSLASMAGNLRTYLVSLEQVQLEQQMLQRSARR